MRNLLRLLLSICCVVATTAVIAPPRSGAQTPAGTLWISEVYPGGGNTDARYANDYVELFNPTRAPVSLDGWALGYSPRTGTTWTSTPLKGTIAAYHYFLVRMGAGGKPGTQTLPAADLSASTNVARTGGKVRLTKTGTVIDLIGFGTGVNAAEGKPAPAPKDNVLSLQRTTCVDTQNNEKDFKLKTPLPRNTKSPGNYCGSSPVLASIGDKRVTANSALTFTVSATDEDRDPLTYSATPLPPGARFTSSTRTFEWLPNDSHVGTHRVTFKVWDGYRSDTETITITVDRDPYVGRSEITLVLDEATTKVTASGEVRPAHPGGGVTVKLFRYADGAYRRVKIVRATLDASSRYRVGFARQQPGRCLITARYHGSEDHPPAGTERSFGC